MPFLVLFFGGIELWESCNLRDYRSFHYSWSRSGVNLFTCSGGKRCVYDTAE